MKIVCLDELYTWLPCENQQEAAEALKTYRAKNEARVAKGLLPLPIPYAKISDGLYTKLEQGIALIREVSAAVEG